MNMGGGGAKDWNGAGADRACVCYTQDELITRSTRERKGTNQRHGGHVIRRRCFKGLRRYPLSVSVSVSVRSLEASQMHESAGSPHVTKRR